MTEIEKAYIAGIIDGEGSIMLLSNHKNQLPSPWVTIASTTIELLNWIATVSRAGTISAKKNYNSGKHKNSYTLSYKGDKAIDLLKDITPYCRLSSKTGSSSILMEAVKLR